MSNKMHSWLIRQKTHVIAFALALVTFVLIFSQASKVGYTRDEGFYFTAAESYARWFRTLYHNPSAAFDDRVICQSYETNREHPVLIKNLMALSYLALASDLPRKSPWPASDKGRYGQAMRLPSQLFSVMAIVLIFYLGTAVANRRVGLLAALMFLLAPRHFYHAQLACFDMPAVAVWLLTIVLYRRAKDSLVFGLACGLAWGLALATKHNSFFIPIVLVTHWLVTQRKEFSLSASGILFPRIPLVFVCMLILGPLVFYAHWPYLWHETFSRLAWYFSFHLNHVNYPWEYFTTLLRNPPFPILYPFALTALTFPLPSLVLCSASTLGQTHRLLGRPLRILRLALFRFAGITCAPIQPKSALHEKPILAVNDAWLLLLNGLIPFVIIALPSVPIFGGIKHWMHAMPFVCIFGAVGLDRLVDQLPLKHHLSLSGARLGIFGLVLLPSFLGLSKIGEYGSSYYNELAGSVRGAADLGMQRQYWSNNVSGVLDYLNDKLPTRARVYFHEVTSESFRAYQRDGLLRPDIQMSWNPDLADFVVYQYHREFVDVEYNVWNKMGNQKIMHGLYIDEVPMILVYDTRLPIEQRLRSKP